MALVTLLTDFGTRDSYVAEMKGAMLRRAPGLAFVDLSHEVPPGDVAEAAYLLRRSWRHFPEGTVHLVVVDPGVGSARRPVAFTLDGHRFVGPDNGCLSLVLPADDPPAVELPASAEAAPTFHGRDVFAPAAAALAVGEPLDLLGPRAAAPLVRLAPTAPRREGGVLHGAVVHVDRFGNLVTSVTARDLAPGARIAVDGIPAGPLRRTFADVPPGEPVAYVGSAGELEVAVRDGSAARYFGARRDTPVTVTTG